MYVYILESIKTGRYYIGYSQNVLERLKRHNSGLVPATKNFCPYKLAVQQKFESDEKARRAEYRLKKLKRKDYIRKVIESGKVTLRAISSSGRATDS